MKHMYTTLTRAGLVAALLFAGQTVKAQNNIGIGTGSPNASAKLDISSTTQGLLAPRMTLSQRGAISSPATGLLIFQTDNTPGFYYYTGSAWQYMDPSGGGASAAADLYGNGAEGVLTISANTDWTSSPPANLNLQYSSITINSGATLTVPSGIKIRCSGNVTINGTITVEPNLNTPKGTGGEKGIARNSAVYNDPTAISMACRAAVVNSLINVPEVGGGSGAGAITGNTNGGGGGGSLAIYAKGTITVAASGIINANGANAVNLDAANSQGSGGGGGGLVVLLSKGAMSIAGTINAKGGNGSDGIWVSGSMRSGGGGGGGGIVCLVSTATPTVGGSIQLSGGTGGATTASGTGTGNLGGNGGASGGNGGSGGVTGTSSASAGSVGFSKYIVTSAPENIY
ncbi:hypothetical protein [Taibaiella sp. KBW10]|uniref:hypothetical protein n=1 Tax=Taibaiella sp. KBW10 TaxID=2153357 RepID=UPI000F599FEC|nr:hypothetical protein [Taibaiella sp. KBW10]